MNNDTKKKFTKDLLKWFDSNHRPLPWKEETNPYLVWLSEIILQQTRVAQGLPYFNAFKKRFPTIKDLADAPEDEVMRLWEGLGYYSRARNLHATAKHIAYDLKSVFPSTYQDIIKLKGVGAYTAAAIASFAYKLPHAVVDGNVYRVLSRYFGIETAIDSTQGKKEFAKLAQDLLEHSKPDAYNQAIMDFGATHCTPKSPKCPSCIYKSTCKAYNTQKIDKLPFKSKKITKRERFFNFLVINVNNKVLIQKREEKDIWRNLYQFPLIETTKLDASIEEHYFWKNIATQDAYKLHKKSKPYQQILTHQKIKAVFWEIKLKKMPIIKEKVLIAVPKNNLEQYAFPKILNLYLQDKSLYLNLF